MQEKPVEEGFTSQQPSTLPSELEGADKADESKVGHQLSQVGHHVPSPASQEEEHNRVEGAAEALASIRNPRERWEGRLVNLSSKGSVD